ncbi:MAG: DUF3604 domain-containing protein [Myxococcota bacterium]|jgi:hypothetical protein|nr:DUF3604 domain-containing protein [Myxococcota bacterium]
MASPRRTRPPSAAGAALLLAALLAALFAASQVQAAEKQLFWGDTHLHTNNSFDAYLNRNMTASPDVAYRYAKGYPVIHPFHRARVQIDTPLDFLVIADHAEYLGVIRTINETGIPKEDLGIFDWLKAHYIDYWISDVMDSDKGREAFASLLPKQASVEEAAATQLEPAIPASFEISKRVWAEAIETADRHNDPGRFTTLIGWEWSSIPGGANLHRVVFTSAGADVASTFFPHSSADSQYPEDLWAWLDETTDETGAQFVAIPHNSNISKGYMFQDKTLRGEPFTKEKAEQRLRWEPVVEVTQIKGDSETHPSVSPDDPFADFETYPHYIQNDPPPYDPQPGDYIRSALRLGLAIEERIGFNPYRFGLIGSTDAHTGVPSAEEPNFWGKLARDSVPENKQIAGINKRGANGWSMSASGLAAVWAEENTREEILEAFRRREVYATTGPRIAVRVFGGWKLAADGDQAAPSSADNGGVVPMGGELSAAPQGANPQFMVEVAKDPKGANLDRVQVVKGWIDDQGVTHERVYDVAAAEGRERDANGSFVAVGNTVDPETGDYTNTIGSTQLSTLFRDPEFDPAQAAFYYVRVLEIPTPRHSVFDALALMQDATRIQGPWWIQERAYTSPIWYRPDL